MIVGRNLPFVFGQNQVSNSWDIPDADKCRQDKCYQDKCNRNSKNLSEMFPLGFGQNWVSKSWDIADIGWVGGPQ